MSFEELANLHMEFTTGFGESESGEYVVVQSGREVPHPIDMVVERDDGLSGLEVSGERQAFVWVSASDIERVCGGAGVRKGDHLVTGRGERLRIRGAEPDSGGWRIDAHK